MAFIIAWGWATSEHGLCYPPDLAAMEGSKALNCLEFWLNRYQGLLGGFFTLMAAVAAFIAVQRQIAQAERLEERRREREDFAARAALPLALDAITDFAMTFLRELGRRGMNDRSALELPAFPQEAITVLQDAVRYADEAGQKELADLIATVQIVLARSRRSPLPVSSRPDSVHDAADLYARASRLFAYGRVAMDRHLVSVDDVRLALRLASIDEEDWPQLRQRLDIREESDEHVRRHPQQRA